MKERHYGLQDQKESRRPRTAFWVALAAIPVLALLGMTAATFKAASDYGFHEALGAPLFTLGRLPVYAPWKVFTWDIHPDIMASAQTVGQTFFILPLMFVLLCVMAMRLLRGNAILHGSARWATEKEIRDMGYLNGQGVYVGGWWDTKKKRLLYLRHNGPEHILCFAPTRSGKGVGLILPTLLAWRGSSVTLDIKGENWALTAGWRQSQGHKVLRFDPTDASGNGCSFNPLAEVRLHSLEAIQDVQNIALMLIDPDGKGLSEHWTKAAFSFFGGAILHCCITVMAREKRFATLHDLTLTLAGEKGSMDELLSAMTGSHDDLFGKFEQKPSAEVMHACHVFIASSAREMLAKEKKERSGVFSTALVNMGLYRDPIIALNTSRSDFRLKDLMNSDSPVDLYLVVPPSGIDRVRPLMRLMVDMIVRHVCAKMEFEGGASKAGYRHRLLFMLDEFTSLGKLPVIEKGLAYIAGYGGKLYIIIQDIRQLYGEYGKETSIMGNCHVRIAYAPNDPETAEVLSKMTGQTTVVERKESLSKGKGGTSRSISIAETARPLLTPDECGKLPGAVKDASGKVVKPGHMLVFTAGQPPIYGRQILYFRDPVFSERSKMPAPAVSDSLYRAPAPAEEQPSAPAPTIRFEDFLEDA